MFKKYFHYFFNSPDEIGFENYLVLVLSFLITIVGFLGTIINILLGLGLITILSTLFPAILFLFLYHYSRKKKRYIITKYAITIMSLILLSIQWFINYGSFGPILYLFVVLNSFVIIFFEKKERYFFAALLFCCVSALFLTEYLWPDSIGHYESDKLRLLDIYTGLIIYLGISVILLNIAISFYKKQQEKAQMADKLKSAFLANMSHEIRTPMNGILGFAELLKNPLLTGEQQQMYLNIIEKSGARMLNLINNIIDISKIESGLMEVVIHPTEINELLDYTFSFFKPMAESKGIELVRNYGLPDAESITLTDREKVYAILINLVKNAMNYTDHGKIEIGYVKKGKELEFFVKDTGTGIPKDRQEVIFERFVQADFSDKMARQGAGLGLSITKAYVHLLNGKIWLTSESGKGSVFYFTIPYEVKNVEIENQIKEVPKDFSNQHRKLVIVVAEDDDVSQELIVTILGDISCEIIKAENGREAVEICKKRPDIDLVLMDIKMPVMDGYEAARKIREFNKTLIIIAQTAYGLGGDMEKALDAGCNGYLAKPINSLELKQMISQQFYKK